ncbi:MAG: Ubiquitin fusion degradation protein 4 [Caeruleum heppii]|nr:MAG: Ubiquitin fusion degradation protein 4 [Caeruleum heppii]
MPSRVTRSATRQAAEAAIPTEPLSQPAVSGISNDPSSSIKPPTRKRKASTTHERSDTPPEPLRVTPPRRTKRQKVPSSDIIRSPPPTTASTRRANAKAKSSTAMSNAGSSSKTPKETPSLEGPAPAASIKRKPPRAKAAPHDRVQSATSGSSARRSKRPSSSKDGDVTMKDANEKNGSSEDDKGAEPPAHKGSDEDQAEDVGEDYDRDDDDDPFEGSYLGSSRAHPSGISNTLRALSGMMSGVSSRLREILNNLKQKDDPSVQLIALQELSELLLVSTEDNLSGHFSPDQFVKELVALMQPSEFGEENPEMMLLACRCIANLMEALPTSTASVVYGGAVPVLCQKLLDIHYIDLAEQSLSTLEKISVEFPASIVREGGLTACLTYLDFFATSTQRTAVTTAANCCRNIPDDSFAVIRDVMPILLGVLSSSDQKVVEQGCLCVSRVVESFKYHQDKLEELVSPDLLKAIIRLLLPGTTNLIGSHIHTQFLRVLSFTARASPKLSAELLQMDIVDTLYQILTGVSPPSGTDDVASEIDSVVIMQALIHKPREQVFETLNVICELLPGLPSDEDSVVTLRSDTDALVNIPKPRDSAGNTKRLELLEGCRDQLKRFAIILLPTLTDAYSSTVNLSVRQKVLNAQLKMLSNLDTTILEEALRSVPYASYLASILSQQDHPTLVICALQATELLLRRLENIYRYQFHREGVIAEIARLAASAETEPQDEKKENEAVEDHSPVRVLRRSGKNRSKPDEQEAQSDVSADGEEHTNDDEEDSSEDENEEGHDDGADDLTGSAVSSRASSASAGHRTTVTIASRGREMISSLAKKFMEVYEGGAAAKEMRDKASGILSQMQQLACSIKSHYLGQDSGDLGDGMSLFKQLATYFDGDALESITSSELLHSEIVNVLLEVFESEDERLQYAARSDFLEVFMGQSIGSQSRIQNTKAPATPFGALVHKLQDLLSRAEHFEVITVHQNSFDGNRSSATSMLAKQLRLKLVAQDDSEIPRPYRDIMVSIHAIATFKALDDYLRPRISLSERPRGVRHREGMSSALAAFAAAAGLPNPHRRLTDHVPDAVSSTPTPSAASTAPARATRNSSKTKASDSGDNPQDEASVLAEKPSTNRRSSRRHQGQSAPPPPPPPPFGEPESSQEPLECADERPTTEDDDEAEAAGAMDAIVDDLNDEMDESTLPDPTAVNLEVASTGKITARKEDGTRVATPSQIPGSSSRTHSALQSPAAPIPTLTPSSSAGRHMSYASAIQAVPQNWHIEFSIDGKPIPNEMTIYRAVHNSHEDEETTTFRNIWSAMHSISFKRVPGPPPPAPTTVTTGGDPTPDHTPSGLPKSLEKNATAATILRLLNILHALNANLDDVLVETRAAIKLNAEPVAQFVNTKLTAKLNRQLEEPLIVASSCLPSWSEDLARLYPFLFPFETRHLFLQSTSFGYSRSMTRWQNSQSTSDSRQTRHRDERPFLGRLQRQKVRISRSRILESAVKVMELYGASPSVLEVEYFEEVGTGLGPTLEFYSTVSKELSKKKLKLWRENESSDCDEYAFGRRGLFPAPLSSDQAETENGKKVLHLFRILGKFVARSMLDSRIIDVSFNPTFFRVGDRSLTVAPSLATVATVDENLANSLKLLRCFANAKQALDKSSRLSPMEKVRAASNIEIHGVHVGDLGLDFTLPGYPSIELIPNGSNFSVTIDNVGLYVEKVIDLTIGSGVQKQIDAFRAGFSLVFPYSALKAFTPAELVMLFGRVEEDWSLETLMDSIKADHGFNMDSKSVKNLLQAMSELSPPQRRDFLQFVTGSPKLPIGGFKSLTPMFTVVCKPSEPPYASDDYLPSVMTCVNYLKLPDYTNLDIMRSRLNVAIQEGQGAFHLS